MDRLLELDKKAVGGPSKKEGASRSLFPVGLILSIKGNESASRVAFFFRFRNATIILLLLLLWLYEKKRLVYTPPRSHLVETTTTLTAVL